MKFVIFGLFGLIFMFDEVVFFVDVDFVGYILFKCNVVDWV